MCIPVHAPGDILLGRMTASGSFSLVKAVDTVELSQGDRLVVMGEQL